jgi:hypothetical protein
VSVDNSRLKACRETKGRNVSESLVQIDETQVASNGASKLTKHELRSIIAIKLFLQGDAVQRELGGPTTHRAAEDMLNTCTVPPRMPSRSISSTVCGLHCIHVGVSSCSSPAVSNSRETWHAGLLRQEMFSVHLLFVT